MFWITKFRGYYYLSKTKPEYLDATNRPSNYIICFCKRLFKELFKEKLHRGESKQYKLVEVENRK